MKKKEHSLALEKLDRIIDPAHVAATEKLHCDMWNGKVLPYIPCICNIPAPDFPSYAFTECYDDIEKNFINSLGGIYAAAMLKDDRLYQVRPEFGVVNIPELFGIPSVVSDQGRSMSESLNNRDMIRKILDRGMPDFENHPQTRKIRAFQDFVWNELNHYENLSKYIHMTLPDTQGPFDLACLIWGADIFMAIYDEPELVRDFMTLMTDTFIAFNCYLKPFSREPMNSAYHLAGLKLVHGGIRICDDSATLCDAEFYRNFVAPCNERAFAAFDGGWLHYCGNGNHMLPYIYEMKGVHALHFGNPDMHDLTAVCRELRKRDVVLFWSGGLENIREAVEIRGKTGLLVLLENRYAPKDFEDAAWRLNEVRAGRPIPKAAW